VLRPAKGIAGMSDNKQDSSPITTLRDFFLNDHVPCGLALTRIFLPLAALMPMVYRLPHVRQLFSTDGSPLPLFELYGQYNPIPVPSAAIAVALYALMVFALLSGSIGWRTRMSFLIGVPLYIGFNLLDAVGTMTKYSVIASHLLILLALSDCGSMWSVDAAVRRRRNPNETGLRRVPVWPVRLMQLLFCFIYFGAAITKIQTDSFFSGEQMRYWMLSNWNYSNPVGELMAMSTPLLLVSAYVAVVWEILFGFLVWRPIGRYFALGLGVTFHLMTGITLGLIVFPAICLAGYFAFVTENDVQQLRRLFSTGRLAALATWSPFETISKPGSRWPAALPAAVGWAATAMVAMAVYSEVEFQLDVYGIRANGGPVALTMIDREEALKFIKDTRELREKDKYFSFDIGSQLVGGQLSNHRHDYEYGDTIVAQCNLNPPHEDLWVELLLKDDHDRIIEMSGQFVTREMLRANFFYDTGNKLVPGEYKVVLRSSGKEIFTRKFILSGDPESLPTMTGMLTN
jgi:HTTM domain